MRLSPPRPPSVSAGLFTTPALLLLLPLAILCCASVARADPVVITGGTLHTAGVNGNFGANLLAPGFAYSGADLGIPKSPICGQCTPGSLFPGTVGVNIRTGFSLLYNGVTYNSLIPGGGTITLPSFTIPTGSNSVTSPFSFSGSIFVTPRDGSEPFLIQLVGSGSVTFTFHTNSFGDTFLSPMGFAFAPAAEVPEPATLILLATGLAGAAAAARRRRKG
jgi:hypothetical protein